MNSCRECKIQAFFLYWAIDGWRPFQSQCIMKDILIICMAITWRKWHLIEKVNISLPLGWEKGFSPKISKANHGYQQNQHFLLFIVGAPQLQSFQRPVMMWMEAVTTTNNNTWRQSKQSLLFQRRRPWLRSSGAFCECPSFFLFFFVAGWLFYM